MGIGKWFSTWRRQGDKEAVRHAEEETRPESVAEREVRTGDVEGIAADQRAAGQLGEDTGGVERLGE
jgi:hypothetical protein